MYDYQRRQTGDTEYNIAPDGAKDTWADGLNRTEGLAQDAKLRIDEQSWYDPASLSPGMREVATKDMDVRLLKYRAAALDPGNPLRGVEIVTNDPRNARFILERMQALDVPGTVRISP